MAAFIGKLNSTIFILGGRYEGTDLIEYDIDDKSYIKRNNSFSFGYGFAQSSVQVDDLLYMMPDGEMSINVFSLTNSIIIQTIQYPIQGYPTDLRLRCLAHYKGYLLVVGGVSSSSHICVNRFSVYNLENKYWMNVIPVPFTVRSASCDIINDVLYVIGGYSDEPPYYLDSVVTMNLSGIPIFNEHWFLLNETLSESRNTHRSVSINDKIHVVGGSFGGGNYLSSVDIIDTTNQRIDFDSRLVYAKSGMALILVDQILYSFGGFPTTNNHFYQYSVVVSTITPTTSPSLSPTTLSLSPSLSPTESTSSPTTSPSLSPSVLPTSSP
eukprot:250842_1